jgi:hypothetical protein
MMLLGTLIPCIADGYKKILHMTDCEVERAIAAGVNMSFPDEEYGALCTPDCPVESNVLQDLSPSLWRSSARAILRMDVYGCEESGFQIRGLRGIVLELETRVRNRHAELDMMKEAGLLTPTQISQCVAEEDRLCSKIVATVKMAMDQLVIA